ncbi:MAG: four helix bundle protein [Planctomycetaceae bacterium]|nr:four helix bundle protein [Planctomycetaceae bacterium]
MDLATKVYDATAGFPDSERYSLTSQLRRAAVSVVSNIAEGAARSGDTEFAHFLNMAIGSCSELDTQLELSRQLGYLDEACWKTLDLRLLEVDRMLIALRKSVLKRS